ncbi:response regulator [Derxia gummosa]|uniref:Response regulator n=1 Tax=Derxia gummosa DSM 723 TaxID=1121388 RepID=A0A8B6X2X6_9BURK|nr:response regulator transcription factor [Derxia gummosa]
MPANPSILVVDDDTDLRVLVCDFLRRYGLDPRPAADGAAMRAAIAAQRPALVVLDLMLPGEDGLALLGELRRRDELPVILLTARREPADRVLGLELGADDYLTKPFEPRELVARIHTVLRRAGSAPAGVDEAVHFDGWRLETESRRLTAPDGTLVALSNAEFRLLSTFLRRPQRIFTREQLADLARDRNAGGEPALDRSIDLLVSRLRRKLADDPRDPRLIRSVRGEGYVFSAPTARAPVARRA